MSISLMTLAWKSDLPTGRKMVLLALCDNANDRGECFPSIPMLAEKCSMGERTVQQHIADLVSEGIISRQMRAGRSTFYFIDPRRICTPTPAESAPHPREIRTPAESAPPQISHPTPADFAPITIKEPSIEPSGNHHKRDKPAPSSFEPLAYLAENGVDEQVAKDWLKLRKARKAEPTKTAIDGQAREAKKAGLSLQEALAMSCERGWQGFKAEWVAGGQARASPPGQQQAQQRFGRAGQITAMNAQKWLEEQDATD
ncbi:MAG TPA: helix-turn-helix domain-containing protein [Burkholderiaceae bacterium]|nr:helix-turn-helix domain-containing protein [Burkholderiaceae bacterium]